MIYTIRTTAGREDIVVDLLISKIEAENIDVKSVFHPAEIKGYVFIEGALGAVHKAMVGLMHSRGLINKPINLGEIQHFLEYKKARIRVDDGDIVEIIGGPFKGEKGRVNRINKIKDEITAELLEASIPIPVTIATEFVRVVKKAHPEKVEKIEEKPEEEDEKSVFDKEELEKVEKEEAVKKDVKKEEPVDETKTEAPDEKPAEEKEAPVEEKPEEDKLKLLMKEEKEKATAEAQEPEPASGTEKERESEPAEEEDFVKEIEQKEKKKKKTEEEDYE